MDLRTYILSSSEPVVADGGMATSLYDKGFYLNRSFEELSVTNAEAVREVTANFKRAGARLLSTNTFGATVPKLTEYGLQDQLEEMVKAAVKVTRGVAVDDAFVLGCMGPLGKLLEPLGPTSFDEAIEMFGRTARALVESGVDGFSLQGFHDLNELHAAVVAIRQHSDKLIIPHIGIQDNQRTNYGNTLSEYVELGNKLQFEVLGLAGDVGPSGMLTALESLKALTSKPIAIKPNAGLPKYVNDQYIYLCNPDYMGKYAKRYVQAGARIVGGHSGVADSHIRAISNAVKMVQAVEPEIEPQSPHLAKVFQPVQDQPAHEVPLIQRSRLGEKLARGERVVTVEILPPRGVDCQQFFGLCHDLDQAGVEFVNIPDGARAVARMGSLQVATYVKSHFKIEPIPHFTARDRNLLGLQSDLLGAYINGVRNILLVTGDPPKLGNTPGATGVYDVDAIGMTHIAARMNRGLDLGGTSFGRPSEFVIGVALNPTAAHRELEIKRFRYKIEAGAQYAITQPIYDIEAYKQFFDQLGECPIPVIMGIWPLVSLRNAEFLKNEVPGVSVPEWVVKEMEKAGSSKDEALKRGLEIAVRTMNEAQGLVAGFQISAPFNRVSVALEAIKGMD